MSCLPQVVKVFMSRIGRATDTARLITVSGRWEPDRECGGALFETIVPQILPAVPDLADTAACTAKPIAAALYQAISSVEKTAWLP